MNRIVTVALALALSLLAPLEASAHHVMGGGLPDTWVAGLLSGIGHPMIGLHYLAFVVAVGLASAFLARRWSTALGRSPGILRANGNVSGGRVE